MRRRAGDPIGEVRSGRRGRAVWHDARPHQPRGFHGPNRRTRRHRFAPRERRRAEQHLEAPRSALGRHHIPTFSTKSRNCFSNIRHLMFFARSIFGFLQYHGILSKTTSIYHDPFFFFRIIVRMKSCTSSIYCSRTLRHGYDAQQEYTYNNFVDANAIHAFFSQSELFRSASWTLVDHNNSTLKIG